ncbi:hypothetical protein [Enterococcus sp. BWR-S5]|uniref:hypothetical protein n=1 Tax=Enterococcus sp. BWR-S5 TaxID=2787714 RepID=UPI001920E3D5|nr:hypothetical protein [Enterococcus sp. BWR-S5]MBL1223908.1 hypothetical protein [Enterococcus sp. BWR-S5]
MTEKSREHSNTIEQNEGLTEHGVLSLKTGKEQVSKENLKKSISIVVNLIEDTKVLEFLDKFARHCYLNE